MHHSFRGFTLIELLVVISIIGVLATFATIQVAGSRDKARIANGLAFSGQARRAVGDEAVAIWSFDECGGTTALDQSGLGNNMTLYNAPTWSTDTPSGKGCSLQVNGVNQYGANSTAVQNMSSNHVTVSIWLKSATPTWTGSAWGISSRTSTPGTSGSFIIHPANGTQAMYYYVGSGSAWFSVTPTTVDDVSKWHQNGFTYDGATLIFYRDGKVVARQAIVNTIVVNPSQTTYIGCGYGASGACGSGWIDDVFLFNKALTAQDMDRMYAEGLRDLTLAVK